MRAMIWGVGVAIIVVSLGQQHACAQRRPEMLGELEVNVMNSMTSLPIHADASGAGVGGSRSIWYSKTHDYDYRSETTQRFALQHLDRQDPPGTDSTFFAYGAYLITVEDNGLHQITMDYRDADYQDGNDYGTGYSNPDMKVYYNHNNGSFYKDYNLTQIIGGSIAIWEDGRKSPAVPKIPVTVANSFGDGQVTVAGSNQPGPYETKWSVGGGVTIAAISPQTSNGLIYQFASWSDAGSQSHQVNPALSQFADTLKANFNVSGPVEVTNLTVGGSNGQPVHISWDVHPNSDVNYYIYRKVKHNGVMGDEVYLTTLSHSTSSYDDEEYLVVGYSTDHLYYDVRAHHVPSSTFAAPQWEGGLYGEGNKRATPEVRDGLRDAMPKEYALGAYPNPFNPRTVLRCDFPSASNISLAVFDVLGRQVSELFKGYMLAGSRSFAWDASSAPSGAYFAQLLVFDDLGRSRIQQITKLVLTK